MLSYDIGRENDRVKASALMNLGILHQQVQNHSRAAQFFNRRKALGFTSPEEAAALAWMYGRSLFYTHRPDLAASELAEAMKEKLPANYLPPLKEHRAFYLQNAGKFKEAAAIYADLFAKNLISGDLNQAKSALAYGYTLTKLHRGDEARRYLHQAIEASSRLAILPKGKDAKLDTNRLIDFQPLRIRLIAYGILGHLGSRQERLAALHQRESLLPQATALYDDTLGMGIQVKLQMAQVYDEGKDFKGAMQKMREAISLAQKLGDSGQYLSHAVYQASVSALAHALLHPEVYRGADWPELPQVVDKSVEAYAAQKDTQPVLDYQKLKLQMLWAAYSAKTAGKSSRADIRRLVASSSVQSPELEQLAKVLED
jgi:hypothetical protein